MNLIPIILIVSATVTTTAALFFVYYSFLSLKFKRGGKGRKIMVAGVILYIIAAFLYNCYLWNYSKPRFWDWILLGSLSLGLVIITIGSVTTWKDIQNIYDIPLLHMEKKIPEVRQQLIGIVLILLVVPLEIVSAIFDVQYFSWLTVIGNVCTAVGFIILAANSRFEYRSIEDIDVAESEGEHRFLSRDKLSTLQEDLALTYAFADLVNSILATIRPTIGRQVLYNTLRTWEEEHPILFQDFIEERTGRISKSKLIENRNRIYADERFAIISNEYAGFLSYIIDLIGKVTNYTSANNLLKKSYQRIEKIYQNHPVVVQILRLIPSGFLENKKLGLMTKNELENKIRERTSELEQSNQQLKAEIEERKAAETKLKNSLQEKNILLKEIHHRVKNNLQVISSLLNLQSQKLEDGEARKAFLASCDRIRSMASIHNQLYRHENLAQIKFSKYIEELTNYLYRSYHVQDQKINIDIDVDDNISLNINKAIPCGLIINELLTNALKYAFNGRESGEIQITMKKTGTQELELIIGDNGKGLDEDFSFEDTKTLGTRLVKRLVGQIDGTIAYNNSNGAKFFINFTI